MVGLGLMGGSLGQALRGRDGGGRRCRRVQGSCGALPGRAGRRRSRRDHG